MPQCNSCKKEKSYLNFRLLKYNCFSRAYLANQCNECFYGYKPVCSKCGTEIGYFTENKIKRLAYCYKCYNHNINLQNKIDLLNAEYTLKRLIKKINKMPNSIGSLRDTLFSTINGLKDGSIQIDTAKQITETAKAIIDSCRVENEFMAIAGGHGSGFIPVIDNPPQTEITNLNF